MPQHEKQHGERQHQQRIRNGSPRNGEHIVQQHARQHGTCKRGWQLVDRSGQWLCKGRDHHQEPGKEERPDGFREIAGGVARCQQCCARRRPRHDDRYPVPEAEQQRCHRLGKAQCRDGRCLLCWRGSDRAHRVEDDQHR